MEPSFDGKAAQDRDRGDHSSHPGGASSRIPRALNITPSSITRPSGPSHLGQKRSSARVQYFPMCEHLGQTFRSRNPGARATRSRRRDLAFSHAITISRPFRPSRFFMAIFVSCGSSRAPRLAVVWVDRRRFSAATRNEIRSVKRYNRRHPPAARRAARPPVPSRKRVRHEKRRPP
jgi:hypothetical protein